MYFYAKKYIQYVFCGFSKYTTPKNLLNLQLPNLLFFNWSCSFFLFGQIIFFYLGFYTVSFKQFPYRVIDFWRVGTFIKRFTYWFGIENVQHWKMFSVTKTLWKIVQSYFRKHVKFKISIYLYNRANIGNLADFIKSCLRDARHTALQELCHISSISGYGSEVVPFVSIFTERWSHRTCTEKKHSLPKWIDNESREILKFV